MSDAPPTLSLNARFVTGSPMRHVIVMTMTGSVGLVALFMVDLADMYFISLLGEVEVAAAIGYAGSVLFFTVAVGLGFGIAASALVARAIGSGEHEKAKLLCTNSLIFAGLLACVLAVITWFLIPGILTLLGAEGRAHELATSYLQIIIPTMPALTIGISSAAILRALGDAKRSMYVTLTGGIVNAVLDPILIFWVGLGLDGAAFASASARIAVIGVGLYGIARVHNMICKPNFGHFRIDVPVISAIALPAILTNVATPVGNAYVTAVIAGFGDGPVAGWAVVGRIIPVAFGVVFALSGSIGPILGQNLGALRYDRVDRSITDALIFTGIYVGVMWALLAMGDEYISAAFGLSGSAAEMVSLFCEWLSPAFAFLSALFIANAAFNNLGRPHYSAVFNWVRATLGTVPFVYVGSALYGAPGALAGMMVGGVIIGAVAIWACYRLVFSLAAAHEGLDPNAIPLQRRFPLWPFSTYRG